jgi:hypothetical protein
MGFTGSTWIVENRDVNIQISADIGFNLTRMEHYINGVEKGGARINGEPIYTPTHFGYQNHETAYQAYNNSVTYLVTTENGRQAINAFPENVHHLVHQWTDEDFERLNADQTVNLIYSNQEFEVWEVFEK